MMKQVSMMKRRPGLSMAEFIDQYENGHARLGEALFPKARRLVRRYVEPQKNPLTGDMAELDFDVILEIWWDSRADFEEAMAALATNPDAVAAASASGARIFAQGTNPACTVVEYDSDMGMDGTGVQAAACAR
ncbi:EthD domain-containing protein [Sphingobium sufflavum]|uniref:EthD domain-containing protein n=1 Tax=Sphingobium sufflavum TaxID=1129547 RepID=UPI001F1A547C|nr:EthD domain-containing protein [Sphingobium sufflavum]MCE7798598.1 EthD domain-containing protein [Sphingobium sufflavum]